MTIPVLDFVEIGQFADADRDKNHKILKLVLWLAPSMRSCRQDDAEIVDRGPLAPIARHCTPVAPIGATIGARQLYPRRPVLDLLCASPEEQRSLFCRLRSDQSHQTWFALSRRSTLESRQEHKTGAASGLSGARRASYHAIFRVTFSKLRV